MKLQGPPLTLISSAKYSPFWLLLVLRNISRSTLFPTGGGERVCMREMCLCYVHTRAYMHTHMYVRTYIQNTHKRTHTTQLLTNWVVFVVELVKSVKRLLATLHTVTTTPTTHYSSPSHMVVT